MHEEFFNERWRHVTRGQCIYKRKTEDINVSTSGAKGTIFYFTIIFNFLDEKFWKRSDFISLMKVLEIFWERCGCLYNRNIFPRKGNIFFNNYDTTSNNVKMVLYHEDFFILLLDPETWTFNEHFSYIYSDFMNISRLQCYFKVLWNSQYFTTKRSIKAIYRLKYPWALSVWCGLK